jgi:hypothetical protein
MKLGYCLGPYTDEMWDLLDGNCPAVHISDEYRELMWHYNNKEAMLFSTIAKPFPNGANFLELFKFLNTDDPRIAANRWWQEAKDQILTSPNRVMWGAFSEPPVDSESLIRLNLFELERMKIFSEEGLKAHLFNFSVGNPDIDKWPLLYDAIEFAHIYGHYIGLHEYFPGIPQVYMGNFQDEEIGRGEIDLHTPLEFTEGWLFGRFQKVWRLHIEPNNWGNTKFIISELGSDAVALTENVISFLGMVPAGWKKMEPAWKKVGIFNESREQTYLDQLIICDKYLMQFPYVVAATIFGLHNPKLGWYEETWGQFNVYSLLNKLKEYIG